jgi:YHS domain-containing protein
MRYIGFATLGVLVLVLALRGQTQAPAVGSCTIVQKVAAATETPVIEQKACPVTGNPINPKIFVDYKGRRIYFCCNMCPPVFNKDPEKYIKIVDEQLKAAKEKATEKVPEKMPETK